MAVEKRIWSKVDQNGPNGCWVWLGVIHSNGYGRTSIKGKSTAAHCAAYILFVGPIPNGMQIDHVCHNKTCVNPGHLRVATPSQNAINKGLRINNVSGLKGVSFRKSSGRWRARIAVNYKTLSLGEFDSVEDAKTAYNKAAMYHFGEFAYLN